MKTRAKSHALWLCIALALCATRVAQAHGMAFYASTPVSPPEGFAWVPILFGLLFLAANSFLLVRLWGHPWRRAFVRALVAVVLFALVFFEFGHMVSKMSTAPFPGLGWGYPVHWGLVGLPRTRHIFLAWNLYGLLFLVSVLLLVLFDLKAATVRRSLLFFGVNVAVYLVCLAPYLWSGAMTHGRAGGYVHSHCGGQIGRLGDALLTYAREHDGRLPDGETMQAVFAALVPHLAEPMNWAEQPVYSCPVCSAFEADPVPYLWNQRFSGATLEDLKALPHPEPVIMCPCRRGHHGYSPVVLFTYDLLNPVTRYDGKRVVPESSYRFLADTPIEEWEARMQPRAERR